MGENDGKGTLKKPNGEIKTGEWNSHNPSWSSWHLNRCWRNQIGFISPRFWSISIEKCWTKSISQ